ncbi:MAG TPA: PilZ domain-containing protein [Sumerlaeia bacterium]|nr:PilZ domain-containing protein [Sumerlaeia bacterium]
MGEETFTLEGLRAIGLLERACAQRALLHVAVHDQAPPCVTRIHDIAQNREEIVVYTFGVAEMDRVMDREPVVTVTVLVDEQPYRFETQCVENRVGVAYHCFRFPDAVEAVQRRAHFRVRPPSPGALSTRVRYADAGEYALVETEDLSVGGIRILDREQLSPVEMDGAVDLQLFFEDGQKFALRGRARHVAGAPGRRRGVQVGIQFDPLVAKEETALSQIIMSWQRRIQREIHGHSIM